MVRGRRGGGAAAAGVEATVIAETPAASPGTAPDNAAPPQRRCIVTGEVRRRDALVRFVVAPDGTVVPDIEGRLPGRGLWLTPRRDIVERAVAKRIFARAARRPVSTPPELADRLEGLLARRCGDSLGLARRAGLATAGFDRVADAMRHGRAALLLFALDGAEGSRRKLDAPRRRQPTATVLTAAELGAAFGRERIVHAAVGGGPLCRRLLLDLSRLAGLRAGAELDQPIDFSPAGPATEDGGTEAHD